MSIPVIPEHKKVLCDDCLLDDCNKGTKDEQCPCIADCPRCLAIKWAQWLTEQQHSARNYYALITIPNSDWEALKKLAEEKVE